jgi:hypothetical protein
VDAVRLVVVRLDDIDVSVDIDASLEKVAVGPKSPLRYVANGSSIPYNVEAPVSLGKSISAVSVSILECCIEPIAAG